jgi:hypothetical protein
MPQIFDIDNAILIGVVTQARLLGEGQQSIQLFGFFFELFLILEVMAHHEILKIETHVGLFGLGFDY